MKITLSETIHCTPRELWPWIDDTEKCKQWLKGLEDVRPISSGPKCAGFRAKLFIREGRTLSEYDETILEYVPENRFKMRMEGGFLKGTVVCIDYQLFGIGGGQTRLDYECEAQVKGFARLFAPVCLLFGRMQAKSCFRRLRRLAEGGGWATVAG